MRQNRIKTGDQALVRQINLAIILDQLRENAPLSRAALAEDTGLNKTTVSSLVSELIDRQLVTEIGLDNPGIGRPSVQLSLNPKAGIVVSAEVGVDFISVISTDFTPQVTYRLNMVIETNQEQDETIDQLLVLLKNTLRENHASSDRLLGVAVGVPGLVDYETGTLLFAPNLGWRDAQLGRVLADQFDAPVIIDNEANLAALGETYFGAARGYREVLYISAGVGIGGGIVRDGAVMRGIAGFAGEFGHMTVDPHGDLCNCGNHGCWETSASQRALFDHIYKAFASGRKSMLQDLVHGNMKALSVPVIVEAAQIGDALALEAIQSIGQRLGIGIASLVNAYNPELVVFGGPISLAWEFLGPLIKEQIVLRSLRWNRETTHLVRARHGADACVMGGVAAVCNQVLVRPSSRLSNVSIPALLSNRGGINFGKEVSSSRRNNSPLRSIAEPSNSLTTSDRR